MPSITPSPILSPYASDQRRNGQPQIPLDPHSERQELEEDTKALHSAPQIAYKPETNTSTVRSEGHDIISPASGSTSLRDARAQTANMNVPVTGKPGDVPKAHKKTLGEKFASRIQNTLVSLARLPADEDVTGPQQPTAKRSYTAILLGLVKKQPESTQAGNISQTDRENEILENRRLGVFSELAGLEVNKNAIAAIINESMARRDPSKPKPDFVALGERFKRAAGFTEEKENNAQQWYMKAGALYSLRSFFTGATGVTIAAGLAVGDVGTEIAAKASAAYYSLGPIGTATGLTPAFSAVIDYIRAWECTPVLAPNIETDERYSQIRASLLERGKETETVISSYKKAKKVLESSSQPGLAELKQLEKSMAQTSWDMEFDRGKKRIKDDLHRRQIHPAKYQTGARVGKTLLSVIGTVVSVPTAAAIPLSLGTFTAGQAAQAGAAAYDEGRKLARIVIMNLKYGYKTFLTEEGQKVYEAGGTILAEHINVRGVQDMFMTRRRILVKGARDYAKFRIGELDIRIKKLEGDIARIDKAFAKRNQKAKATSVEEDPKRIAKDKKLQVALQEKTTGEVDLKILDNGLESETNGSWRDLSLDGSVRRMLTSGPEMMLKDAMRRYRSLEDQLAEVMHQVAYAAPLVGTMQIPYTVEGSGLEGGAAVAATIGGVAAAGAGSAVQYVGASIERYRQRLQVKNVLKEKPAKEFGLKEEATASLSLEEKVAAVPTDSRRNPMIHAFRKVEPTLSRFMAKKPVRLVQAVGLGLINTTTNIVTTPPSYLRTKFTYNQAKAKHNELKESLKELRNTIALEEHKQEQALRISAIVNELNELKQYLMELRTDITKIKPEAPSTSAGVNPKLTKTLEIETTEPGPSTGP